jgi:hypothetical protein
VPDLRRVDPVPARRFTGNQKKIDCAGGGSIGVLFRISKRLAIMAAFRVRNESEKVDNFQCGKVAGHRGG